MNLQTISWIAKSRKIADFFFFFLSAMFYSTGNIVRRKEEKYITSHRHLLLTVYLIFFNLSDFSSWIKPSQHFLVSGFILWTAEIQPLEAGNHCYLLPIGSKGLVRCRFRNKNCSNYHHGYSKNYYNQVLQLIVEDNELNKG